MSNKWTHLHKWINASHTLTSGHTHTNANIHTHTHRCPHANMQLHSAQCTHNKDLMNPWHACTLPIHINVYTCIIMGTITNTGTTIHYYYIIYACLRITLFTWLTNADLKLLAPALTRWPAALLATMQKRRGLFLVNAALTSRSTDVLAVLELSWRSAWRNGASA